MNGINQFKIICACAYARTHTQKTISYHGLLLRHILHMLLHGLLHFAFQTCGLANPTVVSSNLNKCTQGNTHQEKKSSNVIMCCKYPLYIIWHVNTEVYNFQLIITKIATPQMYVTYASSLSLTFPNRNPLGTEFDSNCIRETVKLASWILILWTCGIQFQNTMWASLWWVCTHDTNQSTVSTLVGAQCWSGR